MGIWLFCALRPIPAWPSIPSRRSALYRCLLVLVEAIQNFLFKQEVVPMAMQARITKKVRCCCRAESGQEQGPRISINSSPKCQWKWPPRDTLAYHDIRPILGQSASPQRPLFRLQPWPLISVHRFWTPMPLLHERLRIRALEKRTRLTFAASGRGTWRSVLEWI